MGWGPVEASVEWVDEEAPALAILSSVECLERPEYKGFLVRDPRVMGKNELCVGGGGQGSDRGEGTGPLCHHFSARSHLAGSCSPPSF